MPLISLLSAYAQECYIQFMPMSNKNHADILEQGIETWNQWRIANPKVKPKLNGINFRGADLRGANLNQANLRISGLDSVNLNQANLCEADLRGTSLSEAQLISANLMGADLRGANVIDANLMNANLSDANLGEADLRGAILNDADLVGSNLQGTDLTEATLIGADLTKANLSRAILKSTNLSYSILNHATISRTVLYETNFDRAKIGWTTFANTDLSTTIGLDTATHTGPSDIGISSIFQSKGQIPEIFLRRAGIPDIFITYLVSLTGKAFDFYSCFISYSSKDQQFAERLYADLQAEGVRCWFAPKDLKIGDKTRIAIDESIRKHDKLLLVLSKYSVLSDWVEKEVESAMEQERKQKRIVLFPIRLDDSVLKIENGWPADIRRARNIGNFKGWKGIDSYQKAFARLLHDLKAES